MQSPSPHLTTTRGGSYNSRPPTGSATRSDEEPLPTRKADRPPSPIEVLLVEDNLADIILVREMFKEVRTESDLHVVRNGWEALRFLRKEGEFEDAPTPDIVILDLNMPGMSGHEVLQEIREDPRLARTPVVVLSSSCSEEDIVRSYDLRANCYITKPNDIHAFMEIVRSIDELWFRTVQLPTRVRM